MMNISKLGGATLALALFLLGLGAGRILAGVQLADTQATSPTPGSTSTPMIAAVVPTLDVRGADIADLPRFPDATRVEYRRTVQNSFVVTEVEYITSAELDAVHDFYRDVFHVQEWSVADFNFSQGEWTFFVRDGEREAIVEIESRGPLVEIEIELSEPQTERSSTTAIPSPTLMLEPTATATPQVQPQLTPTSQPAVVPPPQAWPQPTPPPNPAPAPAPPPPGDDDGDDDDGGGDDDGGDDDGGNED